MNKLSTNDLDSALQNNDKRKNFRKAMDNYIVPAGGAILGAAAGVAKAVTRLKDKPKIHEIL